MTASAIASALPKGRKSGSGYVACCPAHEDSNPSLSVCDAADGDVLVHCHAGCSQTAVVAALKELRLWPTREAAQTRRIVATYDYNDEVGTLLYQVVRYHPKDFKQRQPDGHGGWKWSRGPREILYRLPEVLKAAIVFVVEGERDVGTLREYGFVATTNAGGAGAQWLPQYTDALSGREVILIPDNDAPGRKHMLNIASGLLGKVGRLVLLELEGGAKDVTEWFRQGHSEVELIHLIEADHAG